MPASYQGKTASQDEKDRTYSQSVDSNLKGVGGNMTVSTILAEKGDVMHKASTSETVGAVAKRLQELRIGVLVVVEDGAIIGIVSERDIVARIGRDAAAALDVTVGEVMTADPIVAHSGDALLRVMKVMTDGKFRHMPVVDGDTIKGLISIGDVVKFRLRELEYEALRMKQMIVG